LAVSFFECSSAPSANNGAIQAQYHVITYFASWPKVVASSFMTTVLRGSRLLKSATKTMTTFGKGNEGFGTPSMMKTTAMDSRRSFASLRRPLRRKRPKIEKAINARIGHNLPSDNVSGGAGGSGLSTPFAYSGDSVEEYVGKATLSPWTPVPDSVARRIFDNANVQEDDVRAKKERATTSVVDLFFLFFSLESRFVNRGTWDALHSSEKGLPLGYCTFE
jgi:hypothetical protein